MSELDQKWEALWQEAEQRGWYETSATRSITVPHDLYVRIVACAKERRVDE
jgi:hypothetical protein